MKKHQLTMRLSAMHKFEGGMLHLVLEDAEGRPLPAMMPGQFVEVAISRADVLLNRPFSIFNATDRFLELLVKPLGRATDVLGSYKAGDTLEVIAPLGRGFDIAETGMRVTLVGGGVGVAPFYYQARALNEKGIRPTLIYGERTAPDTQLLERLSEVADVQLCTDDGSAGFHGLVIDHPAFGKDCDMMQVCGPKRMMEAVHHYAKEAGIKAQFSLENKMACGLGACLCCVEKTTEGHKCVCSDGPVFNLEELPW